MNHSDFLKSIAVSEALALPFDGLSEGHIKSNCKDITNYTDTIKLLGKKTHLWKKPALYGSVTQIITIAAMLASQKNIDFYNFLDICASGEEIENSDYNYLRHPDYILKRQIDNYKDSIETIGDADSPLIPLIALTIKEFFPIESNSLFTDIIKFTTSFSTNSVSNVYSIFLILLLTNSNEIILTSDNIKSACIETIDFCESNQPLFFEKKINPDKIISEANNLSNLFSDISDNIEDYHNIILTHINKHTSNNVTRLTIEKSDAVIPHAIAQSMLEQQKGIKANIFNTVKTGGSVKYFSIYYSVLSQTVSKSTIIPETLLKTLINKNNLYDLFEKLNTGKINYKDIEAFTESENSLTKKMLEEYNSKNKRNNSGNKKKSRKINKTHSDYDRLSKHVVETWTKNDQAKYRKEKRKHKNELEEV